MLHTNERKEELLLGGIMYRIIVGGSDDMGEDEKFIEG